MVGIYHVSEAEKELQKSAFVGVIASHCRRSQRLDAKAEVNMSRSVDVRRLLNIPETYPGMRASMATTEFT